MEKEGREAKTRVRTRSKVGTRTMAWKSQSLCSGHSHFFYTGEVSAPSPVRSTGFYNLIWGINVNIWNQWRNPRLLTVIRKTNHYFAVILTMFFYVSLIDAAHIFIISCIDVNQSGSAFVFLTNNSRLKLITLLLYEKAWWSFCGAKVDKMKIHLVW